MIATGLAFVCFVAFGVAMRRFFIRPDGVRPRMQVIQIIGPPLALVHFTAIAVTPADGSWAQAAATGMFGGALALFLWAWRASRDQVALPLAFSDAVPSTILTSGPYAHLRHPFYSSYVASWTAGALYCRSWWLFVTALLFARIYLEAIRHEERLLLSSPMAVAYARYRMRVGMLAPRLLGPETRARLLVVLTTLAFAGLGTIVLLVSGVLAGLGRFSKSTSWDRRALSARTAFNHWACRWGLRRLEVRVLPAADRDLEGPALVVSNHVSWLDAFVLGALGRFVFVAKDDLNRGLPGVILRAFGTVFISGHSLDSLDECNRRIRHLLSLGARVAVFPEGRIGSDVPGPFHPAVFEAALEAGVSIVPVGLRYVDDSGSTLTGVAWGEDVPLAAHIQRVKASGLRTTAWVATGSPILPWFRTRRQLASEARMACERLLGIDPVVSMTVGAGGPDGLRARIDALPSWFTQKLDDMHLAGALADPPDPAWRRTTPLSMTSIDSLALVNLALEFEISLPARLNGTSSLTLGDLIDYCRSGAAAPRHAPGPAVRAISPDEMRAVEQLRFDVYVEEMGRPFPSADRRTRTIKDALDDAGVVLGAFRSGLLVGTCRIDFGSNPAVWSCFRDHLQLERCQLPRDKIAIVSRLAISKAERLDPGLLCGLLREVSSRVLERGIEVLVAQTRASLTASFAKIGFEPHGAPYFDADWGSWQLPIVARAAALPLVSRQSGEAPLAVNAPLVRASGSARSR